MAEAGSVWVSVIPSLRGFAARVKSELRGLDVTVNLDDTAAKNKLRELRSTANTRDIQVKIDADAKSAIAELGAFGAAGRKAALVSLVGPGVINGVVGLGAALMPAVGALNLIPAAAGAAGFGILTVKTAFNGFGDAVGDDPKKAAEALAKMAPAAREAAGAINQLKPAWNSLRMDVQTQMFKGLGTQITGLGNTYIPILRSAMSGLASDINGSVVSAFDVLRERGNVDGISTGLGFVRQGLGSMSTALAPLTQAFTTLFIEGAPYVARFGAWVANLAGKFSLFIGEASRSGQIKVWIDNAITVFQELWNIIKNVGVALYTIFKIGGEGSDSLLESISGLSDKLATLGSPAGAEALTGFLDQLKQAGLAMPGLKDALGLVMYAIGQLIPVIGPLAFAFSQVLISLDPFIAAFVFLAGTVLPPVLTALGWLAPVLVPVGLAILAYTWYLKAATIAQTAFAWATSEAGLALLANPITWVVLLIVALVGALIYAFNHWQWFHDVVVGAWHGIVAAAQWAWTNILQPIFNFIGMVLTAVGAAFVWLWQTVIVPAWNAISAAISWAWTNVIWPILSFIGQALAVLGMIIAVVLVAPFMIAWNIISAIIGWAWTNVIQPIFYTFIMPALTALGIAFTWLWQNVIVPVWNGISMAISFAWVAIQVIWMLIQIGLQVLGQAFSYLWNAVVVPVWNGIKTAISTAWNFIRDNIFTPIANFLRATLGPVFQWLYDNVIKPVWDAIKGAINTAWNYIRPIFDTLKAGIQKVGEAFSNVSDWIRRTWDTIKESARKPVQWVVDVVYNNGIRKVWNGIAGLFGMTQLGEVHFAEGGVLPGYTPGRDVYHNVALSGGEGILVPEAVRGLGPEFVGWANRKYSGGRSDGGINTGSRFAKGGIVGAAGGSQSSAQGVGDAIGEFTDGTMAFFSKVFTDPVGAVKELFAGVTGDSNKTPGAGSWTDALKNVVPKTMEGVVKKVKEWVASIGSIGGGAGVARWTPVALAALAAAGESASNLGILLMQMRTESGGNPAAINLWDSNAKKGTPSKGLMQVIDPTYRSYAGFTRPLGIWNPFSNIYASIKYTRATYGSLARGWHGHGYSKGGIVPGRGNKDSVPIRAMPGERVLTQRQTVAFEMLMHQIAAMRRRNAMIGTGVYRGMNPSSARGPMIGTITQQLPDGASARAFAEELTYELRRTGLATGVHA